MAEMITDYQKSLVKDSFVKLVEDPEAVATLFYLNLFQLDSRLKPLFKGDMVEQGRKLMQTISVVVNSIDNLENVAPAVEALGKRHVDYGVKQDHYDTVGSALLLTLEEVLGMAFTPEVRDAWAATYGLIASVATQNAYTTVAP
jgi:hemoglobin-like flavoprotein